MTAPGHPIVVRAALSAEGDDVPLLASIPLSPTLRGDADAGLPAVVADPDDPASRAIQQVAETLAAQPRGLAGRSLPLRLR